MKKFIKTLLELALLICLLTVCVYRYAPDVLPEQVKTWLDEKTAEVMQLVNENSGELNGEYSSLDILAYTGLEKIQAVGSAVAESIGGKLEDTGIDGDSYTFDTAYCPYYGMLTETEQAIYRQVYANAAEFETTFVPCKAVNVDEADRAITAVYNDHPELFWLDMNYSYRYYDSGLCAQIMLEFNETYDSIYASEAIFEARANTILTAARELDSDLEKEKYVHDALVRAVDYNLDAPLNQSAYSALVEGESVCAGYARAFQYLMTQLEIPTYYCTGYSEGDHAWNIVLLDGKYYNVDVTWDDASMSDDYFNCTDAEFADTHMRMDTSVNLPACDAE